MQDVADLHQQAMGLADQAMIARLRGETDRATDLTRRAFEHEQKAALLLRDKFEAEPTRSILFRSAATLALDSANLREAERLIGAALAGNPPEEIAGELRDLLEQVYFYRHLDLRGIVLAPAEFQVSLAGDSIGFGMAPSDELVNRVKDTESLIYRTAERKQARPFREQGRRKKGLQTELELFVSVPRAASFAVTFRIGTQGVLPGIGLPDILVDELLDCLDLLNRGDERSLHERIPDDAYYRNFVSLARKIAPDGHDIRAVGFTSVRKAGERRVLLSTARPNLLKPPPPTVPTPQVSPDAPVQVRGTMRFADSRSEQAGYIQLIDDTGAAHRIRVPAGMMSDIVRPMYEERVVVTGTRQPDGILLQTIEPDTD